VELVEAGPGRPSVCRTGWADLPSRGFMVLAEETRAVAVEPQHLGERRHVVWTLARVSRKRRRSLRDRTHVVHVVVPTAQQRGPGRRAEGRRMEMVVAESPISETFGRRHVNGPAERAGHAKPQIVEHHEEHVWRTSWCLNLKSRWRRRLAGIECRD